MIIDCVILNTTQNKIIHPKRAQISFYTCEYEALHAIFSHPSS